MSLSPFNRVSVNLSISVPPQQDLSVHNTAMVTNKNLPGSVLYKLYQSVEDFIVDFPNSTDPEEFSWGTTFYAGNPTGNLFVIHTETPTSDTSTDVSTAVLNALQQIENTAVEGMPASFYTVSISNGDEIFYSDQQIVAEIENFAASTPPSNPLAGQLWYNTSSGAIAQSGLTYDGNTLSQKSSNQDNPYEIITGVTITGLNVTNGSRTIVAAYPRASFSQMIYDYVTIRTSPSSPSLVMQGGGFVSSDGTNILGTSFGLQTGSGSTLSLSAGTSSDAALTLNGLRTETYTVKVNFRIIK